MRGGHREFFVGIVFFGLLAVLGVLTITAAEVRLGENYPETFRFSGVSGLKKGDDVWVNGFPSGTVSEVSIGPDGVVAAKAVLKSDLGKMEFREDAEVSVRPKSALGGAVVAIETGKKAAKTGEAGLKRIRERVWDTVSDPIGLQEALKDVKPQIKSILANLDVIVHDAKEGRGTVGMFLRDDVEREKVRKALDNILKVSDDLARGDGYLGRQLLGEKGVEDLDRALAKIADFSERLDQGEAALGKLLWGAKTAADLEKAMARLSSVADRLDKEDGALGRMFFGNETLESVRKSAENLRSLSEDLARGDGALGRMLWGEKTGKDLEGIVAKLGSIADRLDSGQGTLGKLLSKDDSLYGDLRDAIRSITRSSEEARENAPILTFAGFLFKSF